MYGILLFHKLFWLDIVVLKIGLLKAKIKFFLEKSFNFSHKFFTNHVIIGLQTYMGKGLIYLEITNLIQFGFNFCDRLFERNCEDVELHYICIPVI